MSKETGNASSSDTQKYKQGFRVAYTINNQQPVQCTIISDQPLFYMDFEGDLDSEFDGEELFDMDLLENTLTDIEFQLNEVESELNGIMATSESHIHEFQDAQSEILKEETDTPPSIEFVLRKLMKSRIAREYISFAKSYGTDIVYSSHVETAQYDRRSENVLVSPRLGEEEMLLCISRELRRVWQHRNGALLHPLSFHPDHAILINRAQIADLTISMIRVAWELQLAGEYGPWERLENSPMADLTRTFARECHLDFRSLNNGVAASAVFESWFLSERCRREDRILIQQMLADYKGYVFGCSQTSQRVTLEMMAVLGSMPYGKNYLAQHVQVIVSDPIFVEVRDRSNANFLWFIKFEQSFRETEHELQTSSQTNASSSRREQSENNQNWFGDKDEEEKIVSLRTAATENHDISQEKTANAKVITFSRNDEC